MSYKKRCPLLVYYTSINKCSKFYKFSITKIKIMMKKGSVKSMIISCKINMLTLMGIKISYKDKLTILKITKYIRMTLKHFLWARSLEKRRTKTLNNLMLTAPKNIYIQINWIKMARYNCRKMNSILIKSIANDN